MSLTDLKLKEADFQERKISDLSDTPSSDGMTAADLKAYFDYIPKTLIAMGALNGIIDVLVSAAGAGNIGGSVDGMVGTTVQTMLENVKKLLDERYSKEESDSLLAEKAEKSTVETMIKSVSFDPATGIFTFTEQGGTTHTFDTALEKVAVNFEYDPGTQSLVLQLADGSTQSISISEFITVNELKGSDAIQVSTANGVTTITVKNGSITEAMLASNIITPVKEAAAEAKASAQSAAADKTNAGTYAGNAAASAEEARGYALSCEEDAAAAEAARIAAEKAAEEAGNIAGGDFVTTTEMKDYVDSIMTIDESTEV